MDATRTFIDKVVSFPTNIEVDATHTYTAPTDATPGGGAPTPPNPFATGIASGFAGATISDGPIGRPVLLVVGTVIASLPVMRPGGLL